LSSEDTKNSSPRIIPLNEETVLMLKMLRKKTDSIFVFGNGRPLGDFRQAWRTASVKAGLGTVTKLEDGTKLYDGLIFHDLRRTGVRNLVRAGVPEQVAMAVSGHKTRSVFGRYNIVSETDLRDAASKLDSYIAVKQSEIEKQNQSGESEFGENTVKKPAVD
jgi:integrase